MQLHFLRDVFILSVGYEELHMDLQSAHLEGGRRKWESASY